MGQKAGASGVTALCYFTWVGQRRVLQEDAVLHENVPEFPVELLQRNLGDLYIIFSVVVNHKRLGNAGTRERRLTWLIHKRVQAAREHVRNYVPWSDDFYNRFSRQCEITYRVFWKLASADEILAEKTWSSNRASSLNFGQALPRI